MKRNPLFALLFRVSRVLARGMLLIVCTAVIATGLGTAAIVEKAPFVHGLRPLGMGDAFIAVADDFNLLWYNPAGLALIEKKETYIFHLGVKLDSKSWGEVEYLMDWAGGIDFDAYSDSAVAVAASLTPAVIRRLMLTRITAGGEVMRTGHIRKNHGGGVFMPFDVNLSFRPGLVIPEINIMVNYDVVSVYSYGRGVEIPYGTFAFGGTFKMIRRTHWEMDGSIDSIMGDIADTYQSVDPTGASIDYTALIKDMLLGANWGFSTDIGFIWRKPNKKSNLAFVANDLICYLRGDWKRPNIKIGYARRFSFDTGWMWEDFLLAVDWVNIIGDEEKVPLWREKFSTQSIQDSLPIFAKRLRIGMESRFMKTFKLRVGIHQGYPTFGAGLDLAALHVQYAFYGREFGVYPGDDGRWFHQAELTLAW